MFVVGHLAHTNGVTHREEMETHRVNFRVPATLKLNFLQMYPPITRPRVAPGTPINPEAKNSEKVMDTLIGKMVVVMSFVRSWQRNADEISCEKAVTRQDRVAARKFSTALIFMRIYIMC